MREKLIVCPSTDPVGKNINNLIEYAKLMENSGADFLHCDIMLNNFVNKNTIGHQDVLKINSVTTIPLDVHLMTKYNKKEVKNFLEAKANIITLHIENFLKNNKLSLKRLKKAANFIKKNDCLFGISIKPSTKLEHLSPVYEFVNLILIMSVEPGESGQKFLSSTYDRIKQVDAKRACYNFLIEVDGGIDENIAKELKGLNVDMVVSGSFVYKSTDKAVAINSLR